MAGTTSGSSVNGNVSAVSGAAALSLREFSKAFGGTQALDGVSFDVAPGTVHALLGGNGCGKSTLIKILAGVIAADSGQVEVGGATLDAAEMTPRIAQTAGLHFVHQQNSTFPSLTVAENLAIGRGFETGHFGTIKSRAVRQRAKTVLARFDIDCDPDTQLSALSPAARTVVAIARAMQDQEDANAGILVLDEPTAALPKPEVDLLLSALRRFAEAGQSILYVTHRLDEVVRIADRVTVLRDGRLAATVKDFDHRSLVNLIMGREIAEIEAAGRHDTDGALMLEVDSATVGPVRGASFTLREGEILGIAGILGSGRSTLLRAIFGAQRLESGTIKLREQELRFGHPAQAVEAGLAFIPEDRRREAAFEGLDVMENIFPANLKRFWRRGRLDVAAERRKAREVMGSFAVKAGSERAPFSSLSGGNQQKAILARWLCAYPQVILLDEPTQGVDFGARIEIWKLVRRAANAGASALVVSSDFEELASACDRVLVLREGVVVGVCQGDSLTENRLNDMAYSGRMVVTIADS